MAAARHRAAELLENRRCLAAFGFALHDIDHPEAIGSDSMIVTDLDGDNDLDFVSENIWRPNGGSGTFGATRLMFTDQPVDMLVAADFDSDGDLDIATSGWDRDQDTLRIAWFENLDGQGNFGPASPIDAVNGRSFSGVFLSGDFDGDGDVDLIESSSQARTRLFENVDGAGTFESKAVSELVLSRGAVSDLDLDGDLDIVASSSSETIVLENQGGQFLMKPLLSDSGPVAVDDVDGNGNVDLLLGGRDSLDWYEAPAGSLDFVLQQSVHETMALAATANIHPADVDGDGDQDVLAVFNRDSATFGLVVEWFEFSDGLYHHRTNLAEFSRHGAGLIAADINGDGAADVVYETALRLFDPARNAFADEMPLSAPHAYRTVAGLELADVDGDGDLDVVTAAQRDDCIGDLGPCERWLTWSENLDGAGTFGARKPIDQAIGLWGRSGFEVHDVDGDGDVDVVASLYIALQDEQIWFENIDGQGSFSAGRELGKGEFVSLADVENDGRYDMLVVPGREFHLIMDFVSADAFDNPIVFDAGIPSPQRDWQPLLDWDGDGDLDVVALVGGGQGQQPLVAWFENQDGDGAFAGAETIVPYEPSRRHSFHDLDGDGDFDLLRTTDDFEVVWREQLEDGSLGDPRAITRQRTTNRVADVDNDGDLDILALERIGGGSRWYLNDGDGDFSSNPYDMRDSVIDLGDVDGDGDLDAITWDMRWLENRPYGDANGDGVFDSADLVAVLQAGEYEDWLSHNSTFQEGDWNGDLDFTTRDLIDALAYGNYVRDQAASVARFSVTERVFAAGGLEEGLSNKDGTADRETSVKQTQLSVTVRPPRCHLRHDVPLPKPDTELRHSLRGTTAADAPVPIGMSDDELPSSD